MAFPIGILTGKIEFEDGFSGVFELASDSVDKFDKKFGGMGQRIAEGAASFFTAEAALEGFKLAADFAKEAIIQLTTAGSEVSSVEGNFDRLTEGAGRLGATLLNELREGLHGTVTDLELMKTINGDLAAGMNLTDDQFRSLADGAFALAQATGVGVKDAFDKVNDALLTGRTRSVEMLTGKIDLTEAENDYAAKLKTTAELLTEDEKMAAKRIAILGALGEATERIGVQTDGIGEMVQQATVWWQNFQDQLGKSVATSPVLIEGLLAIRDAFMESFGSNQEAQIAKITDIINEGAIAVLSFAKTVVDGIGIAGMTYNQFKIVLETVVQGYRAIATILYEVDLAFMKVANTLSGGMAYTESIKQSEAILDSLYIKMAEGEQRIDGYVEAQSQWAVETGKINDKIEEVRQRMIKANESLKEGRQATDQMAAATENASDKALVYAASTGKVEGAIRQTAEEMKKAKEAMKEMAQVDEALRKGQTITQHLLEGINDETEKAIKKYLEAGVSLDKLAAAYGLTNKQAQAISETWAKEKKAADEVAEAWKELNSIGKDQQSVLRGVSSVVIDQVKEYMKLGASLGSLKQAYGLTDTQLKAISETLKKNSEAWAQEAKMVDATTKNVRTLAGEWITAAEAKERANVGGSFTINRGNLGANLKTWGVPEMLGMQLAEKGFSFQEILEAFRTNTWQTWKPTGPRIPGFREGGVGDFGEGTLAMLHGKEAIIPLDKAGGVGGVVNNFYVNGTAEESARKIGEILMRDLKGNRQFGLNR